MDIDKTWLNEPIPDQLLEIEGYQILRKDRINQRGGGVCIYLKHNLKLIRWDKLENSDKETIWITIRPNKLPRDVTNIAIVGVHHPPQSNNFEMKNHLDTGIDCIRSKYPNSGFLLVGDFNQYPDRYLTHCHHFKQTVKSSTREDNILDKCFTNIEAFYDKPKVIS